MKKIKAAVIGLGRIASLLEEDTLREKPCTHAGAITANPDCTLTAGCDINEERRQMFTEKWNVPVYADAAEMLRIHKPQILSIATYPGSHYRYCHLAADYDVPVIICEKPLANNIKKAEKIADLSKSGDSIIITNHERRYSQDYIRAKDILEEGKQSGAVGSLVSVRACLYMGKTTRLLDQLWHDGTHLVDAIMFLTGGILKHKKRHGAKLSGKSGTTWLESKLHFHDQPSVPVLMEIGAGRDHLVFEIEFSCEKGRLRIGNGVFEVWESGPSPYAENFRSLKQTDETFKGSTGYFANMLQDAVSCVRDKNRQPCSSAVDGLRVIEYLNSVKPWKQ